jgi:hypothetical protein
VPGQAAQIAGKVEVPSKPDQQKEAAPDRSCNWRSHVKNKSATMTRPVQYK